MGGKSKSQAASILTKEFSSVLDQEVTLKNEDKELKVKIADTGLSLDISQVVNDCYKEGRDGNFFAQLKDSAITLKEKHDITIEPKIDQTKYDQFTKIAVEQFNSAPADATISIKDGQIVEVPEKNGVEIETANLVEKVLELANTEGQKVIVLDSKSTEPSVKTANFADAKNYAESILNKKITFTYENKSYNPGKPEIGNWIVFSNNGGKISGALSDNNISAYLNKIARDFEVEKKDKKINSADNTVIEEGKEGKLLDKNAVIKQIKEQINNPIGISIAMTTYAVPSGELRVFPQEGLVPGRFSGKYVDVDLAKQKLCTVEGNNILSCYTVSSGKASMPTPTGTFTIQNKNPRAWSAKYGLYMPWWQAFNGPYGLHELPEWPGGHKEGENHLGIPVSHGCVRLGIGAAEAVYNWTDIGTPVYIHR